MFLIEHSNLVIDSIRLLREREANMCHSGLVEQDSRKRAEAKAAKALTQRVTLYSLFRKDVNGRYTRVSVMAYTEKLACRVFSERLFENPLELSIRPIKIESLEAK